MADLLDKVLAAARGALPTWVSQEAFDAYTATQREHLRRRLSRLSLAATPFMVTFGRFTAFYLPRNYTWSRDRWADVLVMERVAGAHRRAGGHLLAHHDRESDTMLLVPGAFPEPGLMTDQPGLALSVIFGVAPDVRGHMIEAPRGPGGNVEDNIFSSGLRRKAFSDAGHERATRAAAIMAVNAVLNGDERARPLRFEVDGDRWLAPMTRSAGDPFRGER